MASLIGATSMRAQEKKWRAESDLDSLVRAEEVKKDKERLAAARALAKEKLKAAEETAKKI
jgi:hypothetical protein